MPRCALTLFVLFVAACADPRVGPTDDGAHFVNTLQRIEPAGPTLFLEGRPVDAVLAPDGKHVLTKESKSITLWRLSPFECVTKLDFPSAGASPLGILFRDATHVLVTDSQGHIHEAELAKSVLRWTRKLKCPEPGVGGHAHPCGMALADGGATLLVALSRNNSLGVVDLSTWTFSHEIPVGAAPRDVAVDATGRAWVSDWAGGPPLSGQPGATSAGTLIAVDHRGIACSGFVSAVDLLARRELVRVPVGLHPGRLSFDGGQLLFVSNAHSDTVSVIDTVRAAVINTIAVEPVEGLAFGCTPLGLAFDKSARVLSVTLANTNVVESFKISADGKSHERVSLLPTGWYPAALALTPAGLFVANTKGIGPRNARNEAGELSFNTHRPQGSVTLLASDLVARGAAALSDRALRDARVEEAFKAAHPAPMQTRVRAVPRGPGETSPIRHVVYIIKENRTYDQVFGDLPQGDGDPRLCIFPRAITPNAHALAEEYVLLDNYYCNGVLSADGHSWATEGYASDHLELSFGGFTRSYTFGDDAAAHSPKGHIWNLVLEHGLSFRNFGELVHTEFSVKGMNWTKMRAAEKEGALPLTHEIHIDHLRDVTEPGSPGWNMGVPDNLRADVFIKALARFEQEGRFPNLVTIYLPNDHTVGTSPGAPTPRAHVAENDHALGRIVDALSHSRFWPELAIFVNEDDPQNGFDHVDGHRSLCLVVSPWSRRGAVSSRFANQTSVLHTIEAILGLPPMHQLDAMAPLMDHCFADAPDLRPFVLKPATVDFDELNPDPKSAAQKKLADLSLAQDLSRPDCANDDELNLILWHAMRGDEPYPAEWAGPHGRGLKSRGLTLTATSDDEEEREAREEQENAEERRRSGDRRRSDGQEMNPELRAPR